VPERVFVHFILHARVCTTKNFCALLTSTKFCSPKLKHLVKSHIFCPATQQNLALMNILFKGETQCQSSTLKIDHLGADERPIWGGDFMLTIIIKNIWRHRYLLIFTRHGEKICFCDNETSLRNCTEVNRRTAEQLMPAAFVAIVLDRELRRHSKVVLSFTGVHG